MLADPQVYTVSTVDKTMPRVSSTGTSSLYQMADLAFSLVVKHLTLIRDKKSRLRHNLTFSQKKIVPDPLTSVNDFETASISVQIERPQAGFSVAELDAMWAAVKAEVDTAYLTKLIGQEH